VSLARSLLDSPLNPAGLEFSRPAANGAADNNGRNQMLKQTDRIRTINDALGHYFASEPHRVPGAFRVLFTQGAGALDKRDFASLVAKVETFDAFTADNDPHREHDFGAIDHAGTRYFWKIDYYDLTGEFASPDPADPTVTNRLLTIMRADEY
jgi:hypothetical protein